MISTGAVKIYTAAWCLFGLGSISCALSRVSSLAMISTQGNNNNREKVPVTLITFDVDGTLVKGTTAGTREVTAHSKAFMYAAGKVFSNDDSFSNKYNTPLEVIPANRYHGCTDGLIMLNIVKYAFGIPAEEARGKLGEAYRSMYDFISKLPDEEVSAGIRTLPGVVEHLSRLATDPTIAERNMCALVTGNVEGIARKKMRACRIFQTGALAPPAQDQRWDGENAHAFLGGFGSDFCSGDIENLSRIYKDRGEQIAIAYRRACTLLEPHQEIVRVVHVGDAPGDVLAAKWCYEENKFGENVCVGCIGVATGNYAADQLQELIGTPSPGRWEPKILPNGMADPTFIESCGIVS